MLYLLLYYFHLFNLNLSSKLDNIYLAFRFPDETQFKSLGAVHSIRPFLRSDVIKIILEKRLEFLVHYDFLIEKVKISPPIKVNSTNSFSSLLYELNNRKKIEGSVGFLISADESGKFHQVFHLSSKNTNQVFKISDDYADWVLEITYPPLSNNEHFTVLNDISLEKLVLIKNLLFVQDFIFSFYKSAIPLDTHKFKIINKNIMQYIKNPHLSFVMISKDHSEFYFTKQVGNCQEIEKPKFININGKSYDNVKDCIIAIDKLSSSKHLFISNMGNEYFPIEECILGKPYQFHWMQIILHGIIENILFKSPLRLRFFVMKADKDCYMIGHRDNVIGQFFSYIISVSHFDRVDPSMPFSASPNSKKELLS